MAALKMKPEIAQAVEGLQRNFPDAEVVARAKDDGGCVVTINSIDVGPKYEPQLTWMKFEITYLYPHADVYPLFVSSELRRNDGKPHGEGVTETTFHEEPALQLSRRNNGLDPVIDTAVLKVAKVIQWFREQ